jgi:hypothetical protein
MLSVRQKSFLVQAECALKNISRMLSVRKIFWAHTQHVLKSLNVLPLDVSFFCSACMRKLRIFAEKTLMSKEKFKNKLTINVPLFKKLRDIIFFFRDNNFLSRFEGHFEGAKTFLTP